MAEAPIDWKTYSVAALFDSMGKKYETAWAGNEATERSIAWLLAQLTHHPGSRILDIGCGTGKPVVSTLAAAGHRVQGIDVSDEMLAVAREAVPAATFEKADMREYRAEPGSLDAVTSYFAFLVALSRDQIGEVLGRVHGWLRPGGLFVFATIPNDVEHSEGTFLGRKASYTSLPVDRYVALLKEIGFVIEHEEDFVFHPKAAEAGICTVEEQHVEHQWFVYARKPAT